MIDAILIKLGGSLITEKSGEETPRQEVIDRLAREVAALAAELPERIILGHGSGSFGHVAAQRSGIARGVRSVRGEPGVWNAGQLPGVARTQERAAALHRLVVAALLDASALPFSIAPSSCVVADGGRPADLAADPLVLTLAGGLLPVLYGDVVTDRSWGFSICSTERLFELLARRLPERGIRVRRALWLGETDGVYDRAGATIPRIASGSFAEVRQAIGAPAGTDVTGGMLHRVETALRLADLGIRSSILNGLRPGVLRAALAGEEDRATEIG
jgi:isopentenyl phosphate kinase